MMREDAHAQFTVDDLIVGSMWSNVSLRAGEA